MNGVPLDHHHIWTPQRQALWQRLSDYRFSGDQPEAFVDRVAHACQSTRETAQAAIEEYRRFCFLAVGAGHAVTPSEIVDRVWHTHMTDTRDYWLKFCPEALEQPLHHSPSLGGLAEDERHRRQYFATVDSYRRYFGDPPTRFWAGEPQPARLTADESVWLPLTEVNSPWLFEPKGLGRWFWGWSGLLAAVFLLGGAGNGTFDPLEWRGGWFLTLYFAVIGWTYTAGNAVQRFMRGRDGPSAQTPADSIELGFLAGGAERAADVALVELLTRDAIRLDYPGAAERVASSRSPVWLRASAGAAGVPSRLLGLAKIVQRTQQLAEALPALQAHYARLAEPMRSKGWWLSAGQRWRGRLAAALPMYAVVVLGVTKISIGEARGRPVGFLVVLTALAGLMVLVQLCTAQRRTRAGDRALLDATIKTRRSDDLAERVALAGTMALVGTPLAEYHTLRTPVSSSSDSSSSSSGCGSGGDSGGGGCGGCGGGGD
ncbi:TIGR04222 domain-containing membrane protein [Lysobacter sp. ESA13C]|uniref:TIGR04222 domain-containing membrane protein n=1 Tax=Lysobacter sp. ESA13C TaxID=2862676 RepID=UPI001CC0CF5D|nr:TIGR04222 domain-containing membrane protein [Lysobacter sp. ESA13C]